MSVSTSRSNKGVSLSRGPALALGTFLVIAGLYFVYMESGFPRLSQFPSGTAHIDGKAFFGVFGLNGWSGELTIAAGALLLVGAAQHALAKTASLLVAIVLGGVGIWALVNSHSALGLFAANIWTILLWFAAAAYLLINAMLPRVGGDTVPTTTTRSTVVPARSTATGEPVTTVNAPATTAHEPITSVDDPAGAATETTPVASDESATATDGDHAVRTRRKSLRRPRTRI